VLVSPVSVSLVRRLAVREAYLNKGLITSCCASAEMRVCKTIQSERAGGGCTSGNCSMKRVSLTRLPFRRRDHQEIIAFQGRQGMAVGIPMLSSMKTVPPEFPWNASFRVLEKFKRSNLILQGVWIRPSRFPELRHSTQQRGMSVGIVEYHPAIRR
jgi:hypothetical protein